ncbi:MAG TPA: O-antigen ligase family protein [Syntrophorhabdales bacterium]|nr:O-antigen ligase family protein [Syntrophorhabdales bacterium]
MLFDLAVIGIFCYAALAWGSNEPWAMAVVAIATFTVLAGRTIWDFWRGKVQIVAEWAFVPLLLFLAYAGLQRLRPATALFPGLVSPPLTLEPHSTGLYLLLATAYVALIYLVTHGFRSREQVKRLILCVIVLGAFEALYGLIQYLGGFNYIWDYQVTSDRARGTLINSNHYAFLLNLSICCGFGYLYYRVARLLRGQNLSLRSMLAAPGSGQLAWLVLWLGLMGTAVVFSMSRMGIVAMLAGIGMMIVCAKASEHGTRTKILGLALLCVILVLAVYTGIDTVLDRFDSVAQSGYFDKDRFPIWRQAWSMIQGHTTFGQGLGTFQWSFPAYEDFEPDMPAKYAHNDYLQALAEVGWVGLLLIAAAFAAAWRSALRNLALGFDSLTRGIGVATLGVLTVAAVQEISDFSLYIPGVAALFAVLIGLNFRARSLSDY